MQSLTKNLKTVNREEMTETLVLELFFSYLRRNVCGQLAGLRGEEQYADWAIVNYRKRKVLAAKRWGWLERLTRQEVKTLLIGDREAIQTQGLTLGGMQCSVIRDNMGTPGERSMDLRTKPRPGRSVAVRCSRRVLVVLIGQRGVHGAVLHQMAYKIASNIDDGNSQMIQ